MNFELTTEQQQLNDSLRRYLDKAYSFELRRKQLQSGEKYSPTHWHAFAELGLLGIGIPEEFGGMGTMGNRAETIAVTMGCFGRALVVEPYLATVVLCGGLLREAGSQSQRETLLPAIAEGRTLMALATHERAGRYVSSHVETLAQRQDNGYRLNGSKFACLHGDIADTLIISARSDGKTDEEDGISLFLVDRDAAGLEVRDYRTLDGQGAAEVRLNDVWVAAEALVGSEGAAYPAIERAIDDGIVALCAEAVGAMEALCEQTLDYLKTRKQFGVTIGSFQALQHRMVNMFMASEQARSMAMLAAIKADSSDVGERRRVLAAAKSLVGQSALSIGKEAIQMHGGMGMTDELPISHYFKRLTAIDLTFGDANHHRSALGNLLAAEDRQAA